MSKTTLIAGLLATALSNPSLALELNADWWFADGLEFVNPPLLRTSVIRVLDPHFYVSPGFGCLDFTDNNVLGQPGTAVNAQLNAPLNSDSEPNGMLDASTLWLFQPGSFNVGLENRVSRFDSAPGSCSAPVATTSCAFPSVSTPDTLMSVPGGVASCFEALAQTTGGYTPAVASLTAPCFITNDRAQVPLGLSGVNLTLYAVRTAGGLSNGSVNRLSVRGFLRESDADLALIPSTVPLIGGRPLSALLAGGTGSCSTRNDKDSLNGVPGWWFYLEQTLVPVPTAP